MKQIKTDSTYLLEQFGTNETRRTLLKSLMAMGVGASAIAPFAQALAAAADDDVKKLTILSQPGVLPQLCATISNRVVKESHPALEIQVEDSNNATSYPRMLAQRNKPVISGGMMNDYFAQRGISDGMWEKFDPALMTNRQHVPDELMTPGGYGIPFLMSPYGIMYNPDRVEKPESWADLWNPKYEGRVSMWDAYFDAYVMAAVTAGKGPDVTEGIKAWAPYKKNIGAWVSSPIVESDLVHRGEVWLAPHWGAYAELAKSQGKNVAFTVPKEGAVQWSCHMQLCKGFPAGVTRLAQQYMNTWLGEEFQLAALEKGFFSPVNASVKVPDHLKKDGFISVDDARTQLIRPDFAAIGSQIPKLKGLIDRTLRS